MFRSKIIMFDSVTLEEIPPLAKAVAGYVNGTWPTFIHLPNTFPKAEHLSITVSAKADAECLDIEHGDASPSEAPEWVRRQRKRGVKRPVLYCNLSTAPLVLNSLQLAKIRRGKFRLWTAHYTMIPHICNSRCGYIKQSADATQYTNRGFGRNLDISLCHSDFFGSPIIKKIKKVLPSWLRFGHI